MTLATLNTAANRRRILANAHAAWIATSKNPKVDAIHNLKQALVQTDYIASHDMITDVRMEGTTVCIFIDCDDFKEGIELDAYGNTLRGTV